MKRKNKKSIDLKTHQITINVLSRLGISEPTFYKDLKFLEIEITKDNDNCSWISNEDVNKLLLLRKWIKIKKRRAGFDPEIAESLVIDEKPEITTEDNLENITTSSTEVATEDSLEITITEDTETITESTELTITESTELTTTESTELGRMPYAPTTESGGIINNDAEETANFNRDLMIRAGAKLKAKELAIPHLITRAIGQSPPLSVIRRSLPPSAIADEFTEETLPSDLKQKVQLAREAANPKYMPQLPSEKSVSGLQEKISWLSSPQLEDILAITSSKHSLLILGESGLTDDLGEYLYYRILENHPSALAIYKGSTNASYNW